MYASQVWGIVYLSEGSESGSQLQKRHLCSLRRIFGVKNSATNWAVLSECGQEPLQFFWFRASIRLLNSMLDSNTVRLYVVC
jgi:DNA-binding HxlR family transcriptional regulator